MADLIPHMVWSAGPDGVIDYFNQRILQHAGMTREELQRWNWIEAIHPEDRQSVLDAYRHSLQSGDEYHVEYRLRVSQTGEYRWFQGHAIAQRDQEGRILRWYGTSTDIEERKQAKRRLQEREERLFKFIGAMDEVAIEFDTEGRILQIWSGDEGLLKMPSREQLGKRADEVIPPELSECLFASFERVRRTGEPESFEYQLEVRGGLRWFLARLALVSSRRGAEPTFSFLSRDITSRKEIEAEKGRLLKELEAIFTSAAEGIILHGEDGTILRINPAAMKITGLSEAHIGSHPYDLYKESPSRNPDGTPIPMQETAVYKALNGSAQRCEIVPLQHRDGQKVWISFSGTPIVDSSGHQVGMVATFADITRLRDLQEQMENYLHMMAHDLRTPLTVISGYAEILQGVLEGSELAEESLPSTRAILSAADQMREMMEDLVDFGYLESGQITLHDDLIDLRAFTTAYLTRQQVSEEYRRVRLHTPAEVPLVRMGVSHLERVVSNLIGNALKYSPPELAVDVEVVCNDGRVYLVVQDYGEGIAAEDQARIFERFFRAASGRRKAGGTGLGLYISRSLLAAYGGDILLGSEPGRGARFTLCLPEVESAQSLVAGVNVEA
jgi:PAS domain S-box-containing protein